MADDLDWNAIIAPGNDAERRRAAARPAAPEDEAPARAADGGQPLSRREARAREAANGRRRTITDPADPTEQDASGSVADAPVVSSPDELHPEVHALLTSPSGPDTANDARTDGDTGAAGAGAGGAAGAAAGTDDGGQDAGGPSSGGRGGGRGGGSGRGGRGRASRPPREPRRKRSRGALIAGIVIVAVVIAAGVGAYGFVAPKVGALVGKVAGSQETDDYTGSGTSKVTITIKEGDIGEDVAKTLQRSGVVKTSHAFYQLLLSSPDVQFQPGSYTLKKHMSSKSALTALQDKKNKTDASIVVPEGTALKDIEAGLVSKAGLSEASVQAAAKNLSAYGLPEGTTTLEGWLFPATYPVNPGWNAQRYFLAMVQTMKQHLSDAGVKTEDQEHVITFASLVQKEAGLAADYPKVARVFQNRIDQGMPLQSDATVAYGTGNTHRVTTTDEERADASNKYNTYQHLGLPPAPISNPGDVAIKAVTHPASGNWLYFVTVNLETGQTTFSDTYDQHLVAVKQFQAWLRAHPSYQ